MGLLVQEDGEDDVRAVSEVVESVADWWNTHKAPEWGFTITARSSGIANCCQLGSQLFHSQFFAESPSPFKRVAAFLVICRLHPFWAYAHQGEPFTAQEEIAWNVRLLALAIPSILTAQQVTLSGKPVSLPAWTQFPSPHYLLEFFAWLRWITAMHEYKPKFSATEWGLMELQRTARMVLACSLMVEASYYAAESDSGQSIRRLAMPCLADLDEDLRIDLFYDTHVMRRDTAPSPEAGSGEPGQNPE